MKNEDDWISSDYSATLVSVIVPTHNRGGLVLNALESVRRQAYRPVELIIVDDGSTDDTEQRVAAWRDGVQNSDLQLHVLYVKKQNGGAPSARNEGLRRARGEFVQFLDSDDALGADKLVAHVRVLHCHPLVDYVWSRSVRSTEYLELAGQKLDTPPRIYAGRQRVAVPMRVSDGLYRRGICAAVGPWNVRLTRYQDWEYNIRALSLCRAVAFLNIAGYVVLLHDLGRISRTSRQVYAEQIIAACDELSRCAYPYMDSYLKRYMCSQALISASVLYLMSGDVDKSVEVARRGAREAPISNQKVKALAFELGLRLAPRAISRLVHRM